MQSFEKFKKLPIFFIDAKNLRRLCGAQLGEKHGATLAKFGDPATHGHAVRAAFFVAKTL